MLKSFWTQFHPHPFRTLLLLEWLLLGAIAVVIPLETLGFDSVSNTLSQVLPPPPNQALATSVRMALLVLTFLLFGLLGLRLPATRRAKTIYIAVEYGLFGAACFLQTWNSSRLVPLLVIIIIRNCLLFSAKARWWMLGLTGLVYLLVQLPAGVFAAISLGFSPEQLAAFKGQWQGAWGSAEIFSDGRVALNVQLQPEQVNIILSLVRPVLIQAYVTELTMFALMALFVVLLVNSLLAERQGRKKLAIAHEQLYQYSRQIEDQAALQERNRIARDLHDSLGHLLTAQNIQLQNAALHLGHRAETAQTYLTSGINIGTQALTELRQTLNQLRHHPFKDQPFQEGITDLIQGFQRMMPTVELSYNVQITESIPNRIQIAIYRITEEALMNVYKHSHAQRVEIQIVEMREAAVDGIRLSIADNGQGFEMSQIPTGFGLRGIRERSKAIGGRLSIISKPQQGCRIELTIPMMQEERR
jgi:signal transduction histidine kinase